jgi:hypothetical protein
MILQVNDINFENMTNDEAVSAIAAYVASSSFFGLLCMNSLFKVPP